MIDLDVFGNLVLSTVFGDLMRYLCFWDLNLRVQLFEWTSTGIKGAEVG